MVFAPHEYQQCAIEHVIENPYAGLFLDMGLGKTVATLTAIDRLMFDSFEITKVLVIAPLRVAEDTWPSEVLKWDHLRHLTVSKVLGSERERKEALIVKADIYVINRENVPWLIGHYGRGFPFDMVVIDELSSFKSAKAVRFKSLRQIRPFIKRVVGLTGTPAPNSLIDLWPQLYLLDMGERLGKSIGKYREAYFKPGRSNGHVVFDYKPLDGSKEEVYAKISDICISMKSEDFLKLPERIDRFIEITLPEDINKQYLDFERSQVLALMGGDITAANAAALSNKLLQFSNGAIYDEDRNVNELHSAKLEALEEIVDTANGKPVLVLYSYKHDLSRIQLRLKKYKPKELKTPEDIKKWNAGETSLLLVHPKSAGHGLNLQAGGNIVVWFGLTWSLEEYQQANARLHRQGQQNAVIVHHLVTKGCIDEDVIKALGNKAAGQDALMNAVKARIDRYRNTGS